MKYLKTYEQISTNEPQIGDYVVCQENVNLIYSNKRNEIAEFTSNNVGKIVNYENSDHGKLRVRNWYIYNVQFENIPNSIKDDFLYGDVEYFNSRIVFLSEIVYWSKDKIDCETFISAKKYNMRYLKLYESFTNDLQIGNYVVCQENSTIIIYSAIIAEVINFTSNNVGKYIKKTDAGLHLIKYKNIPEKLIDQFKIDKYKLNVRLMTSNEIIYWSKNEKDCEIFISAKKYNI